MVKQFYKIQDITSYFLGILLIGSAYYTYTTTNDKMWQYFSLVSILGLITLFITRTYILYHSNFKKRKR